jgi:hypothetical protein
VSRVRDELTELTGEWRHVSAKDPENGRPVVLQLLDGRVNFELNRTGFVGGLIP